MESAAPRFRRVVMRLLVSAIVLQWLAALAFVVALALGETTYPTFLALYAPRYPLLAVAIAALLAVPFLRRQRKVFLPVQVGVCLVVLFPVMGLSTGAASRGPRGHDVVRLATYNVYFGKLDRTKLLAELTAMNADILLLQATYDSMPATLKARFPDSTVHSFEDFILVTRLPLRDVVTPKPLADGASSMFVSYAIDTPGGRVGVYNVHPFSPRHALYGEAPMDRNVAQREAQIAAAVGAARADGGPFLVVGDTNLPGWSSVGRRHLAGLKDAFEETGAGFGYTFPAKRPWMRIDRALGSDGIRFVDSRVGPRGSSDHLPLVVEFEVSAR